MNTLQESRDQKVYRPSMSSVWWLKKRNYFLFMMRELSSVFVAAFVVLFMYQLFLISEGEQTYGQFKESLYEPQFIVFYIIAFFFSVYHTITWFSVASKVQIVRIGTWTMPPAMVTGGAFVGWMGISAMVGWFFWI